MAEGNAIVLHSDYGRKLEGYVSGTPKPGTVMQLKAGTAAKGGRFTYEVYNRDADGDRPKGPLFILDIDYYQGKTKDDAYVDGSRCFLWVPLPGDEFNMLVAKAGTGTGDAIAIGDQFIVNNGDGLLIATTGSVESEPFISLEAVTDVTATGTLVHVQYTGY